MEIAPASAERLMTAGAEVSIVVLGMTSGARRRTRAADPASSPGRRVYDDPGMIGPGVR